MLKFIRILILTLLITVDATCDLSDPDFVGFLMRVRALYKDGYFESADHDRISQTLASHDELLSKCPVAVLQALLLKLEENIVYEPRAFEDVMVEYAKYLGDAVVSGSIDRRDFEQWPINEGLERVSALSRALADRVDHPLSSAMVMNFCQAKDRFGEMHELNWLLEPPFGIPEANADDDRQFGLLQHTDLYIYLVDQPWCSRPNEMIVQRLKRVVQQVFLIPYVGGPDREEQTAYFKFIVDHYDNLPDYTIFVHPDAHEHQGASFNALRKALTLIRTNSKLASTSIGYYPLAQQMIVDPKRTWGSPYATQWRRFWNRLYSGRWRDYGFRAPRCRWDPKPLTYISGLVEGAEEPQTRQAAKALCAQLPDCVGITCDTLLDPLYKDMPFLQMTRPCTARHGTPEGPLASPMNETSLVKNCAISAEGTAHDSGVYDADQSEANMPFVSHYLKQSKTFLAGFAANDQVGREIEQAKLRCNELGVLCTGITCENEAASYCTVRAGGKFIPSPVAEVSFVKVSYPGAGGDQKKRMTPPQGPSIRGGSAFFQAYMGSQSVVHRDRIRVWPRSTFEDFAADGTFCSEFTAAFEAIWHAMFGEPLSQFPRERDPTLPLYLKWGVPTKYSYGDEGVL